MPAIVADTHAIIWYLADAHGPYQLAPLDGDVAEAVQRSDGVLAKALRGARGAKDQFAAAAMARPVRL